jgi:ketosteroid isomerase-like protein
MSEENVEIVRRVYGVLAKAAEEEAVFKLLEADLVDPDGELDFRTAYPDGPVVRLATLSEFFDNLPWGRSIRIEPESFRAVDPDRVLVFVRLHAVGTASGVPIEGRVAHLLTLRDNRIVRTEIYTDRGKALEAAGLSE